MPSFNFSVSVKPKKNTNKLTVPKSEIFEKDVKGIVWIDMCANYFVRLSDNRDIYISKECFTCKDKAIVFRQAHPTEVKFAWNRLANCRQELNTKFWLPFFPGLAVTGNIVKSNGITKFIIKDINIFDNRNPMSLEAYKYYKENKKEIDKFLIAAQNND